ncbi:MAG: ParB/RepB/Spo0J family partition protein [Candidatus Paracaedimonas acanthamoebae]|uniref:ParB/RepB/Spo0J family partition protein n=1 Tax=Candidatus Paracaedimonas acanthamoebae TaxID=244581 RepID=A0A8J7TTV0_9PROT|nr:ParB/RepB/Spo0J family partition protein [Candidatus Paracaedimonas acanthamoebae]
MSNSPINRSLGRGLDALLGPDPAFISQEGTHIQKISLFEICPGKYQPREHFDQEPFDTLVESIREKGVIQPILIRPLQNGMSNYEIVAGERRWRAAKQAGLQEIPALVKQLNDREALELALIENIQRHDLSILEEAQGYKRLMEEFDYTQEDLAKSLSKSRSHIANTLRLLNLPDNLRDYIRLGKLTAGHARALLGAKNPSLLGEKVVKQGLNVRQTEQLIQKQNNPSTPKAQKPSAFIDRAYSVDDKAMLENELKGALNLAVALELKGDGGHLNIHFSNLEELDYLVSRLLAGNH